MIRNLLIRSSQRLSTAPSVCRRRFRRLESCSEQLEVRTLLTTYVVNTLLDEPANNAGVSDGLISLREAIRAANNNTAFGDAPAGDFTGTDRIVFSATLNGQTITLQRDDLDITDELIIDGPGSNRLTIDAGTHSRHFDISNTAGTVEITGLKLINGDGTETGSGSSSGGSIRNNAQLTLNLMWIDNNVATSAGAINSLGGTLNIFSSAITGNYAPIIAGGIAVGGTTYISNSTISGNRSDGFAGGIRAQSGANLQIINSTIAMNVCDGTGLNNQHGGGLGIESSATVAIHNTLIAGNFQGIPSIPDDVSNAGTLSGFNNLIGDAGTSGGVTNGSNNNIVGVNGAGTRDINTILNPIVQNNGGSVPTHALLPDSAAVNAGDFLRSRDHRGHFLTYDGRGTPFNRNSEGGPDAARQVDIGAFELQTTLVVNTLNDETTDPNTFSLREALAMAALQDIGSNIGGYTDSIFFASLLNGGTITLNGTDLDIAGGGDLNILGPGATSLTISGNNLTRIFDIASPDNVVISALKLTGGNDTSSNGGGAILHRGGDLILDNLWITGNRANTFGGAIDNDSEAVNLTIQKSTIDHNHAGFGGGGIDFSSTGYVVNSTISSNSADLNGGGIHLSTGGEITVVNTTIFGNQADADGAGSSNGGGAAVQNGTATFRNTIVAGNTSGLTSLDDELLGNVVATSNNNLIGAAGSAGGLSNGSLGNIVGVHVPDVLDPILRSLSTSIPTHALISNSPAINRGNNASAVNADSSPLFTDERGPGFPRILEGRVDIGAYEGFVVPRTSISGFFNGNWWLASPVEDFNYQTGLAASGPASTFKQVLTGDFNGDGIEDLACWLFNGEWRIGLADGNGNFNFTIWTTWTASEIKEVHVGDFNQDGSDDIIGLFKNGTRGRWWVAQSDGEKFINKHWGDFGNYNGIAEVLVGNFDGVKGDDLTIITLTGNVFMAKTSNTQFQYLLSHQWGITNGFRFAQAGDFNGDGRDDVVAVFGNGATRSLFVAKSVGPADGFASLKFAELTATQSFDSLVVGDFNGDGKDDIAARINTTKWWVGLTGTNLFSFSLWTTWSFASNGVFDIHVGSTNGDHRSDLIGRDSNGKWISAEAYGDQFYNRSIETWAVVDWQFVNGGDFHPEPAVLDTIIPPPEISKAESSTHLQPLASRWNATVIVPNGTPAQTSDETRIGSPAAKDAQPDPAFETFGSNELLNLLYAG